MEVRAAGRPTSRRVPSRSAEPEAEAVPVHVEERAAREEAEGADPSVFSSRTLLPALVFPSSRTIWSRRAREAQADTGVKRVTAGRQAPLAQAALSQLSLGVLKKGQTAARAATVVMEEGAEEAVAAPRWPSASTAVRGLTSNPSR